jgi:hypothetical protein
LYSITPLKKGGKLVNGTKVVISKDEMLHGTAPPDVTSIWKIAREGQTQLLGIAGKRMGTFNFTESTGLLTCGRP